MRKIKKLTALMLAVVMVLAMSITAFAGEVEGGDTNEPSTNPEAPAAPTTTVGKTEGHTYQLYQIFTGVYDLSLIHI